MATLSVILAVGVPVGHASGETSISFELPGYVDGALHAPTVNGAILAIGAVDELQAMSAADGSVAEYVAGAAGSPGPVVSGGVSERISAVPIREHQLQDAQLVILDALPWATLVVEARALDLRANGPARLVDVLGESRDVRSSYQGEMVSWPRVLEPAVAPSNTAAWRLSDQATTSLSGSGSVRIVSSGITWGLLQSNGNEVLEARFTPVEGSVAEAEVVNYFVFELDHAVIALPADAISVGLAWGSGHWNVAGTLILPRVEGGLPNGWIANQNQTAEVSGNASLHGFSSGPGGRVTMEYEGSLVVERLDGAVFADVKTETAWAATATTATILAILARYAFTAALFTRLPPEEALKHPRRKALKEYIDANPGATFREVMRETGIPAGTCRHHLSVLQRSNLIVEHRHRQTVRFFENHGKFDESWQQVIALRDPEMERLHAFIAENPQMMQKQILDTAVNEWGWSRSTTQHRLERLVAGEAVSCEQWGRRKIYSVPAEKRTGPWATT